MRRRVGVAALAAYGGVGLAGAVQAADRIGVWPAVVLAAVLGALAATVTLAMWMPGWLARQLSSRIRELEWAGELERTRRERLAARLTVAREERDVRALQLGRARERVAAAERRADAAVDELRRRGVAGEVPTP